MRADQERRDQKAASAARKKRRKDEERGEVVLNSTNDGEKEVATKVTVPVTRENLEM